MALVAITAVHGCSAQDDSIYQIETRVGGDCYEVRVSEHTVIEARANGERTSGNFLDAATLAKETLGTTPYREWSPRLNSIKRDLVPVTGDHVYVVEFAVTTPSSHGLLDFVVLPNRHVLSPARCSK